MPQELKHFSEAAKDLQRALELDPSNKAFAKELERLKQDCAEQRKQRAVLKQLDCNNSMPSNASASGTIKQPVVASNGTASEGPVQDLQRLEQLVTDLQAAGTSRNRATIVSHAKVPSMIAYRHSLLFLLPRDASLTCIQLP